MEKINWEKFNLQNPNTVGEKPEKEKKNNRRKINWEKYPLGEGAANISSEEEYKKAKENVERIKDEALRSAKKKFSKKR